MGLGRGYNRRLALHLQYVLLLVTVAVCRGQGSSEELQVMIICTTCMLHESYNMDRPMCTNYTRSSIPHVQSAVGLPGCSLPALNNHIPILFGSRRFFEYFASSSVYSLLKYRLGYCTRNTNSIKGGCHLTGKNYLKH